MKKWEVPKVERLEIENTKSGQGQNTSEAWFVQNYPDNPTYYAQDKWSDLTRS